MAWDSSATYTVAQGTIITSALSAFVTGLYGITSANPNYGILAGAAALNSGITAATFFGLREYAISPILVSTLPWPQYARRRRELGLTKSDAPTNSTLLEPLSPSFAERRTYKLLDSGLSGAATGGVLRGWKSGPTAIVPGAITAATICVLLQYAFNEAGIARLRYISRHHATSGQPSPTQPLRPSDQHILGSDPPTTLTQRLMHAIGLRKMTDEEYLEKTRKTRDYHLQRIAELEKQLEAERGNKSDNNS